MDAIVQSLFDDAKSEIQVNSTHYRSITHENTDFDRDSFEEWRTVQTVWITSDAPGPNRNNSYRKQQNRIDGTDWKKWSNEKKIQKSQKVVLKISSDPKSESIDFYN